MPNKPNQQSPLIDKGGGSSSTSTGIHPMTEMSHHSSHHPNMAYTIVVDLINMGLTTAEIALVLYLSIHHFIEEMGVIAVAMLAPILLNFVGVTYFFSNKTERDIFEKVGTTRFTKDMFQVPVFGPMFTAIKVLLISTGLSKRHEVEYERFEASAVKMRQAQTFFSAAPEAVVQLSLLLVKRTPEITTDNYLEIAIVIVSVFTLAEANVYALRSNYFRLFHSYQDGDWRVHLSFGKKCILFLHSLCSIASRICATACLIAGVHCISIYIESMRTEKRRNRDINSMRMRIREGAGHNINVTSSLEPSPNHATEVLGLMIGLTLICLIMYHMVLYYVARFLRYKLMRKDAPGGCYESINYGWRSTLLHTGFQSKNILTQIWFYLENCVMFGIWAITVRELGDSSNEMKQAILIPMTIIFTTLTLLSVFFLFAAVGSKLHNLRSCWLSDKTPESSIS